MIGSILSGYIGCELEYIKEEHYFIYDNVFFDSIYSLFKYLNIDEEKYINFTKQHRRRINKLEKIRKDEYERVFFYFDDFLSLIRCNEIDNGVYIVEEKAISKFGIFPVSVSPYSKIIPLRNYSNSMVGLIVLNKDNDIKSYFKMNGLISKPLNLEHFPNILYLYKKARHRAIKDKAVIYRKEALLFRFYSKITKLNVTTIGDMDANDIIKNSDVLWLLNGEHTLNGELFSDYILRTNMTIAQRYNIYKEIVNKGIINYVNDEFFTNFILPLSKINYVANYGLKEMFINYYIDTSTNLRLTTYIANLFDSVSEVFSNTGSKIKKDGYNKSSWIEVINTILKLIKEKKLDKIIVKQKKGDDILFKINK